MTADAEEALETAWLDRPTDLLEGIGANMWQAYNAMETTKRRHYDLLEIIDNKKKNYNIDPTEKDQRLLSCLLQDHDEQVKRFTRASQELKQQDPAAHLAIFAYMSGIGQATERYRVTH